MARSQELARLFQHPDSPAQRRYEICRAYFHEGASADQLARAVDATLVRRLTNTRALHQMLDVLAKRGRRGIAVMRQVLDEAPLGVPPAGEPSRGPSPEDRR